MANLKQQIDVLKKNGVKVNEGDVLWCINLHTAGVDELIKNHAADSTVNKTKLLFLEKGNAQAGLEHSWIGHKDAFQKISKAQNKDAASKYIQTYMGFGHNATYGFKKDEKRGGFEVVYQVNEKEYLVAVFGSNGYIITAYPVNKNQFDNHDY